MQISLDGPNWTCKYFQGEDWLWRGSHLPVTRDRRAWLPGRVPGSVHHDLWQAGQLPNPYFELNSLAAEWASDRTWLYRRTFTLDPSFAGQRVRLYFKGVDYEARFFLNGELLGSHRGMYTPAWFEIGERARFGEPNHLAVVIEPAPFEQPQVGYTSRVRTHKSRMTYWWDFSPRLVHLGLWDSVYLEITGPARIEDLWARPQLSDGFRRASVTVTAGVSCDKALTAEVEKVLTGPDGETAARQSSIQELAPGLNRIEAILPVEDPQLWWPNGRGGQPLYQARLSVRPLAGGGPSDEKTVTTGLRQVDFLPNEGASHSARPYTLSVNGQAVYINGWNWVPLDLMYGVERPAKLDHLLELARRADVNLLRVWGGGLIEKDSFYDRCDRLGILVWQEFIQSSSGIDNEPPRDPGFIAELAAEARQIIPRLRSHPSLALWCGGNELQLEGEHPVDDDHPLIAALKAVVEELDPGRGWLPSSPSGPVFGNSLETITQDPASLHDVHGPWEYQGVEKHYTLYNAGTSLLSSEFGVEGLTNRRALDRVIAPQHQHPANLDNPYWCHLAAWWIKEPGWRVFLTDSVFDSGVETVRLLTQFMQADGLRYAVEANRRRMFRHSGSLPWQFNEPYPMAVCTSAVDYFGQAKPVYYAVARAYQPLALSLRFPRLAWAGQSRFSGQVWGVQSGGQALEEATLELRLTGADGTVYGARKVPASLPVDRAVPLLEAGFDLNSGTESVFFADLALESSRGELLASNRYAFTRRKSLAGLLEVSPTVLSLSACIDGDRWLVTVENTGPAAAMWVWLERGDPPVPTKELPEGLEPQPYFSGNYFCLLPGERRTLAVDWPSKPGRAVPEAVRCLSAKAWNSPEARL